MTTYNHMKPGLFNVGSYQVSGVPWITGSVLTPGAQDRIRFPRTVRSVTVINTDASNDDLLVHFNATGSGRVVDGLHFVALNSNNDSVSFGVKCREIFVSAPATNGGNTSYTAIGELSNIPSDQMFHLTGSGLTD